MLGAAIAAALLYTPKKNRNTNGCLLRVDDAVKYICGNWCSVMLETTRQLVGAVYVKLRRAAPPVLPRTALRGPPQLEQFVYLPFLGRPAFSGTSAANAAFNAV